MKKSESTAKKKAASKNKSADRGKLFDKFSRLTPKQKRLWELEKFLLRVLVMVIPVYLILTFGISTLPAQYEVARESEWLMSSMGMEAAQYGTGVIVGVPDKGPFFFVIGPDCTGWKAMLFFAALLLAVPRRAWRARIAGMALGLSALWVMNVLRVVEVVQVYASSGYWTAMLVHDYLWQVGMGAAALVLWLVWLRLSRKR
jgi:exosortase/archaeosortase family protein